MAQILINGLDINEGTNYRVKTITHDDSPPMRINSLEIARRDGEKLISTSFAPKRIEIEGTVKSSTHNGLVEKMDELKKYCLNDSLIDLDIPYGAETRRYQVQVHNVFIAREPFNVNFAPFTIVAEAIEEPFGRATTWSEALSVIGLTNEYETFSPEFDGSTHPVPKLSFVVNTAGNLEGIHVFNKNTNTRLETFTGFRDNDVLEIDTDERNVELSGDKFSFDGIFPEFEVGENSLEANFITADSIAISQEQKNTGFSVWKHKYIAQAFQPSADLEVPKLEVYARHDTRGMTAAPDDLTLRIETDNAGVPSGSLVHANAEVTIPYDSQTANQWYWFIFQFDSDISLTNGTDYWIVIKEDWTKATRTKYFIGLQRNDVYTDSSYTNDTKYSYNYGSSWDNTSPADPEGIADVTFRVWDRQSAAADWDVSLNIDYKKRYL